ncbi:MAG: hypothetical protein EAY75_08480 [Bacteroidetes bacterium]|nr:MAG: hypothetical protein EAY75_08480 [Bacteroidota bacterium]
MPIVKITVKSALLFGAFLVLGIVTWAQKPIDVKRFFEDDSVVTVAIETDLGNILNGRLKDGTQGAKITMPTTDGAVVTEDILLSLRGNMRRSICTVPPIKLLFKQSTAPMLSPLKNLKLVNNCKGGLQNDQLLLKEYLVYKMYNLLTPMSFRVRLLHLTYSDSKGKKKPFTNYAFLIEDVDAMAKRSDCIETNRRMVPTEATQRAQTTLLMLFEYMIGNTDFSVPANHNVRLIIPKADTMQVPYTVPYDFDYSGLVNAPYAIPDPMLPIQTVTERLYRGFARSTEELTEATQLFKDKKEQILALINDCAPLEAYTKREVKNYLQEFFELIESEKRIASTFIYGARRE